MFFLTTKTTTKQRLKAFWHRHHEHTKTDCSRLTFRNSHILASPPSPAIHLDSGSGSGCQAFPGPPSPLGSRGEEEEDKEGGKQGPSLSLSFFQLTNWQLIDGYLLSLTKSSISITKAMYSRVGQTVNYMLPPLPRPSLSQSLSLLFTSLSLSLTHSAKRHGRQTKQNKVCFLSLLWALKQYNLTASFEGDT